MNQEKLSDLRSLYRQIALETESHNGDLFLAEIVEEQDQEKLLFTAGADGEGRPAVFIEAGIQFDAVYEIEFYETATAE